MKTQREDRSWGSVLTVTFGTTGMTEVRYTGRPHFTPKEIPWYSLLLEATECGEK